jgi:hypothetical protein
LRVGCPDRLSLIWKDVDAKVHIRRPLKRCPISWQVLASSTRSCDMTVSLQCTVVLPDSTESSRIGTSRHWPCPALRASETVKYRRPWCAKVLVPARMACPVAQSKAGMFWKNRSGACHSTKCQSVWHVLYTTHRQYGMRIYAWWPPR